MPTPTPSSRSRLETLGRRTKKFQEVQERAKARFEQQIRECQQSVLDALFASHPDLEAIAFTLRFSIYNDEGPESGLDGVLVAGEVSTEHPAFAAAKTIFARVEAASEACWPIEGAADEVTLVRRIAPASCELTAEDAWEHDGHTWLEELAAGEYPPKNDQDRQHATV
jgi:hypothetical protein